MKARPLEDIPIEELLTCGVWEYDLDEIAYDDDQDETWLLPVRSLPVDRLGNRLVATEITLANGTVLPAVIGNISVGSVEATREFATISLAIGDEWFHLERYFDLDYEGSGPDALASRLGLPTNDVFPLRYDMSGLVLAQEAVTKGSVPLEPDRRLSDEERMDLLFS